ncbi:Mur ligase [Tricharina praecox]|uniref:Mur ligase n=1 Tax=Tricharina praecox TaxID=43433 RepID=UPI00221F8B7D|nr:Mur ligase [Tricharina praecox]KAI5844155.1 Mur ligase [Tricharina praecox]
MIDLTLKRITQLLPPTLPWSAIHVAGTNGKGSVCAYLSTSLTAAGLLVGRFTSPHLIDRWDCISINNAPIARATFVAAENAVLETNARLRLHATEFELLTATAFEVFTRAGVQVGVVEVGLGGRQDATNALRPENVLVSVVTRVGLDHQGFLGGTLAAIAGEKAGITKRGVPLVVDADNPADVVEVVRGVVARAEGGEVVLAAPEMEADAREGCTITTPAFGTLRFPKLLPGAFQPHNLACAVNALSAIAPRFPQLTGRGIVAAVANTKWPGRLEHLEFPGGGKVLVDGAHNPQAQRELRKYLDGHVRAGRKVWWVLAVTKGKDVAGMVEELVAEGDAVVATRFGKVDGMPWITAVQTSDIAECVKQEKMEVEDCVEAVRSACRKAKEEGAAVVVAGSLYLVGDLHRYLRGRETEDQVTA